MFKIIENKDDIMLTLEMIDGNIVLLADGEEVGWFDEHGLNIFPGVLHKKLPKDDKGRLAIQKHQ